MNFILLTQTSIIAFITITLISYAYPIAIANAATCFKKGEYTSGFNKICIYNCLGSDVLLCPRITEFNGLVSR